MARKRNLTLNIGLHYEINTPFVEDDDVWANFDPATGTQLLAGLTAFREPATSRRTTSQSGRASGSRTRRRASR